MDPGSGNSDSIETANKIVVRTSNVETDLLDICVRKDCHTPIHNHFRTGLDRIGPVPPRRRGKRAGQSFRGTWRSSLQSGEQVDDRPDREERGFGERRLGVDILGSPPSIKPKRISQGTV